VRSLLDPFADAAGRHALAEIVVLAAVSGPVGVWVLAFRQSFAAEGLSHGMVPGLVVAALAGLPLVAGAAGGALLAAAGVGLAARERRLGTDGGVAVTVTAALGIGALIALGGPEPERLEALLFGDLLHVTAADVAVSAAVAAVVLIGVGAGRRALAASALDPVSAPALGFDPRRAELGLLVALAVVLVAAVGALGSLLAVALVVAPAGAARRLATRLGPATAIASAFALAVGVSGLWASRTLGVEPSGVIALAAVGSFGLVGAVRRLRPR
jgi:ABC-type Mn2+/Zn2+ transport system permease subunit